MNTGLLQKGQFAREEEDGGGKPAASFHKPSQPRQRVSLVSPWKFAKNPGKTGI